MHIIGIYNAEKKMPEIKVIAWLFYDITMLGIGGYTFANAFVSNVDLAEKICLFIASMIFFWFRIVNLRHDNEKKKLDNESLRMNNEERKEERRVKQEILNNNKKQIT